MRPRGLCGVAQRMTSPPRLRTKRSFHRGAPRSISKLSYVNPDRLIRSWHSRGTVSGTLVAPLGTVPSNGGSRRPIAERCWHHHEHARGTLMERQSLQTESHFSAGGALCREVIHEESVRM